MTLRAPKSNLQGERLANRLIGDGITNQAVLQVMANTPRELFVDPSLQYKAFENTALPIGQGQTISQPYIVAKMTELLLASGPKERVLEIGTGSGYQCAVLAQLVGHVYSVERIKSLQWQAKRRLRQLDLHNVSLRYGDGWQGWASKGPYEAIMVTAAAAKIPEALLEQLVDGGCLIIPVGEQQQVLQIIKRHGDEFSRQQVEAVRFVPLLNGELA